MPQVQRPVGASVPPDIELDRLEPFDGDCVQPGFVLEYAELGAEPDLTGTVAASGTFSAAFLNGSELGKTALRGVSLRDVIARRVNAANADWTGARLNRVLIEGARFTGTQLREAEIRETTFRGCQFDYVNFRLAQLVGVTFEDCDLGEADFGRARLERVRMDACRLRRVDVSGVELAQVDLRGSEIDVNDPLALRGAVISPVQLIELSAALAHAAGIDVQEAG